MNNEEIVDYLTSLDKESRAIKEEALKLSWYMRGGASYDDIMYMSVHERKTIGTIIKENVERSKKSGFPIL